MLKLTGVEVGALSSVGLTKVEGTSLIKLVEVGASPSVVVENGMGYTEVLAELVTVGQSESELGVTGTAKPLPQLIGVMDASQPSWTGSLWMQLGKQE